MFRDRLARATLLGGSWTLPFLASCAAPEAASHELEGVAAWFRSGYRDAADVEIAAALSELLTTPEAEALPRSGTLGPLPADAAGPGTERPGDTVGFFLLAQLPCRLDAVEALALRDDQAALYPETYLTYRRDGEVAPEPYLDRYEPVLEWEATFAVRLLTDRFTETVAEGLRWVPQVAAAAPGPAVLAGRSLLAPAATDSPTAGLPQDVQVDLYADAGAGELFHARFRWWEVHTSSGVDADTLAMAAAGLAGFEDQEARTTELCGD